MLLHKLCKLGFLVGREYLDHFRLDTGTLHHQFGDILTLLRGDAACLRFIEGSA